MRTRQITKNAPALVTKRILQGSLFVAIALTTLLAIYDLSHGTAPRIRFWVACAVIGYMLLMLQLLRRNYVSLSNWLIIILYEALVAAVFLHWGLSSSAGVLTASFVILLPGILMAPRFALPVAILTSSILIATYLIHSAGIIKPTIYIPKEASSLLDVIAYMTILSVFALITWISANQSRLSLNRALKAEESLMRQRDLLSIELKQESSKLRQSQLQQIQQLYRFAVIGQSTAATLHELSNHLSVLNLDINDLKTQIKHSEAIANAEEGIDYINRMVRRARAQLNTPVDQNSTFNVLVVIDEILKDYNQKYAQKRISINKSFPKGRKKILIKGEPLNLAQCITILLNNALEACALETNPQVSISVTQKDKTIFITVSDNGPGISDAVRKTLFHPLESTKSTGLGVGLYIANHLIKSHFKGSLKHLPSSVGAQFQITLKEFIAP